MQSQCSHMEKLKIKKVNLRFRGEKYLCENHEGKIQGASIKNEFRDKCAVLPAATFLWYRWLSGQKKSCGQEYFEK